ncbi:MAG: hypothetical protein LBE65_04165 [Synergistaceae bacterium]|jgi:hypothetical protein|nr:hypothetical protein [Synergistaceae bacterium]
MKAENRNEAGCSREGRLETESGRGSRSDASPARQAGIAPGEIHVNVGMIKHSESGIDGKHGHGGQIRNAGYTDTLSMIVDVVSDYQNIYEGSGNSILLTKPVPKGNGIVAVEFSKDEEGIYKGKTAWIARDAYFKKKKLLFARSEPLATGSGTGSTSQFNVRTSQRTPETNANRKSNSNTPNISQTGQNGNSQADSVNDDVIPFLNQQGINYPRP